MTAPVQDSPTLIASFPAAGAGSGTFQWLADAAARRGADYRAMANPPSTTAVADGTWRADAAADLRNAVQRSGARRVVLVGHSMGGLSAVCLAEDVGTTPDTHVAVLVLNTPCPDEWGRIPTLSSCSDAEIGTVLQGSSLGPDVLGDPELLAEVAAHVRSDAQVADRLALEAVGVEIDVLHVVATRGDTLIATDRCEAWRHCVVGGFHLASIDGDHMALDAPPGALDRALTSVLDALEIRS